MMMTDMYVTYRIQVYVGTVQCLHSDNIHQLTLPDLVD